MLPQIILHIAVSVDGRIDWFTPDVGQFYELIATWNEDATLAGSDTICKPGEEIPPEDEKAFLPITRDPRDTRPLLVVPDSKGRVRKWHVLRESGFWRDMVALCSRSTPRDYLNYLSERHIDYLVAGDDYVDFRTAMEELNARYDVQVVRVDSGGTLNGVLLRAGLVHEVSVLLYPSLVGGTTPRSFFRASDLISPDGVIPLELIAVEKLKGDVVWLRYQVVR